MLDLPRVTWRDVIEGLAARRLTTDLRQACFRFRGAGSRGIQALPAAAARQDPGPARPTVTSELDPASLPALKPAKEKQEVDPSARKEVRRAEALMASQRR